jgi:hypothetical protein
VLSRAVQAELCTWTQYRRDQFRCPGALARSRVRTRRTVAWVLVVLASLLIPVSVNARKIGDE